ncbi:MAG: hypothetical protein ACLFTV_12805 [Desulfococcaceae bacterium]
MLRFAVSRPGVEADAALESALAPLSAKGVLIYRDYADEFRLWEGTDIDIPAAIERQKPAIAARPLAELLESAAPLSPLVASRHGYRTGLCAISSGAGARWKRWRRRLRPWVRPRLRKTPARRTGCCCTCSGPRPRRTGFRRGPPTAGRC